MGEAAEGTPVVLVRGLQLGRASFERAAAHSAEARRSVPVNAAGHVLAISGGIGEAKLALGLQRVLPSGALTVVANTGDDSEHLDLAISPDVDTTLYILAGLVNPATGWGDKESWRFMAEIG